MCSQATCSSNERLATPLILSSHLTTSIYFSQALVKLWPHEAGLKVVQPKTDISRKTDAMLTESCDGCSATWVTEE